MATPVKLPLSTRKSIRDKFDPVKTESEEKISSILGVPWTIDFDLAAVWGYAHETSTANTFPRENTGGMLASYATSAVKGVSDFATKLGSDGIAELNKLAPSHSIVLESYKEKVNGTCSCDITDGKVRIIFSPGDIGVNINSALVKLADAVNAASVSAGGDALPFNTRSNIKSTYDVRVGAVETRLAEILGVDKIQVTVDFPAIYATLLKYYEETKANSLRGFENFLGGQVIQYLETLPATLTKDGFDKDDMLQEALREAVSNKTVTFRLVEKLERKTYNETVIHDGTLYLQTFPKNWSVNINQVANGIEDIL